MNNKFFVIITLLLLFIVIALIVLANIIRGSNTPENGESEISGTPQSFQSPTPVKLLEEINNVKSIKEVPTLNPQKGLGLDLDSAEIQNSTIEISKIKDKLPYKKSFVSGSGLNVSIIIPSYELLDNEWSLLVYISDIDYQISEADPNYEKTKDTFRQAALDVFFWLKENGVNTEKIIIKWGDREFIQNRSNEWLN